jgi:ankyrin repeat protein
MIYLIDDTQGGDTALNYAKNCGCVQLLIQAGADVYNKDNVSTLDAHTISS